MKRLLTVITIFLIALAANAQPRAVGISVGAVEGVSFQHMVYGQENFFQLDLGYHPGTYLSGSMRLTGTYNYIIASPRITSDGTWNLYAGPGVTLGTGFNSFRAFNIGVAAQVGVEYAFWFPLQLSVDLRPSFGVVISEDRFKYDVDGVFGFIPTISARYVF